MLCIEQNDEWLVGRALPLGRVDLSAPRRSGPHRHETTRRCPSSKRPEQPRPHRRRERELLHHVPGLDCLHAAGDPRIAAETLAAHRAAVRSALAYLESEACWTRRGAGGTTRLVGEGFVGVEYVHRVSRAGDAQLHSHVVIANMTRADGRWTTLDGQALYAHLKTASALYHAELRAEMTRRLGVEWEPVAPGKLAAEIRGVPRAVLRDQSRRRQEIVRRMEDRGESSPRAAQAAALDTRKAKDYDVDRPRRRARAAHADRRQGVGPGRARRRHRPPAAASDPSKDELVRISRELLGPAGMTEHRSTFSRRDAIEQWADTAPPGRVGRANRAARRPLAGPAGDRRAGSRLGDSRRSRRPAAADAARPPRRAALLDPDAAGHRAGPARDGGQAPPRGRGRRPERDRHPGARRAPDR